MFCYRIYPKGMVMLQQKQLIILLISNYNVIVSFKLLNKSLEPIRQTPNLSIVAANIEKNSP